ncbi:alpha/beta fold family Hydrolase [Thecamonas trahens ATCC 50062]|uniref:Alpha/beta fold family Hydrolase n=1 Tax=Thecamonas trahens ATCC 50062 TaxID=461836 RepID=A0A0L0DMH6_THETB|nr:alpha/beta fold family Hydrolase [Thecamonas trahens ATCC 50062]KNC53524.1 alpha/beta fold family Hydrolase [Thecamonas trahens ATCC 50062]|eukprot:XP_013761845.1 alpha/beta fold family Hydrolase [Thecamonas trahens ATCC 50062]
MMKRIVKLVVRLWLWLALFVLHAPRRVEHALRKVLGLGGGGAVHEGTSNRARPAELDDPVYGEHVTSRRGLHYVKAGDDDAPVALMLHGFPEFWFGWRKQIVALKEQYQTVAVDMRGYNLSVKPTDVSAYGIDALVSDVATFIEEELAGRKVVLVAHDWGGVVAWFFAYAHPELIDRLVILNAPHPRSFVVNADWAQIKMSWYIGFFQLPYLPELLLSQRNYKGVTGAFTSRTMGYQKRDELNDAHLDAYRYAVSHPGALESMINYYRQILAVPSPRLREALRAPLQIPVLIIWGTEDKALGTQLLAGIERYVKDVRIELIDGASHWVQVDAADRVNELILGFAS